MPLEPEPQPGIASTNQTTVTIASATRIATTQLRAARTRAAPSVAVDPNAHERVLVHAVPREAHVEVALRPRRRRVRTDATAGAVLVLAVGPDVAVEAPPEGRGGRPAVAPEVRDGVVPPAPPDLLVVPEHHHVREIPPRGPRPPRAARSGRVLVGVPRFGEDARLEAAAAAVDVRVGAPVRRVLDIGARRGAHRAGQDRDRRDERRCEQHEPSDPRLLLSCLHRSPPV